MPPFQLGNPDLDSAIECKSDQRWTDSNRLNTSTPWTSPYSCDSIFEKAIVLLTNEKQ